MEWEEQLSAMIVDNVELYDRVLTFQPIDVAEFHELARTRGMIGVKRAAITSFLEREGVAYAQPWRSIARDGETSRKKKKTTTKKKKKKRL